MVLHKKAPLSNTKENHYDCHKIIMKCLSTMLQHIDDMLSEFALVNWTADFSNKKTA